MSGLVIFTASPVQAAMEKTQCMRLSVFTPAHSAREKRLSKWQQANVAFSENKGPRLRNITSG